MEPILLGPELLQKLYEAPSQVLEHFNEQDADVFQDGEIFCCRSANHYGSEIFGYGETPEIAIKNWHSGLKAASQ